MSGPAMLCRSWGIAAFAFFVGCVEVPDTIRAQFSGPSAEDRTNYRRGTHGAEPAPVAKASTTTTTSADAADATDASVESTSDGGAP
jgi:hypothetical protein